MSYNKNQEAIDKYYQDNYDRLREEFVDYLVEEGGYSRFVAEESNDWFDEWLEKDFTEYMKSRSTEEAIIEVNEIFNNI